MQNKQGILYIASGKKYILAAISSAKSVLRFCPGLPMQLIADWQNYDCFNFSINVYPFNSVEMIQNPHRRSKVDYLSKTPFEQTLYLDTDTRLNSDIRSMYEILDRFDIALAHAHRRNLVNRLGQWRIKLPQAFPQFNSGVFLYNKSPKVIKFLEEWSYHFKEAGFDQDQMTLRELIWLSDLRIATLPPEYNVRFLKYHYFWSKSEAITKIFHLQVYHDGPFGLIKNGFKKIGRAVLIGLGLNPGKLKKIIIK